MISRPCISITQPIGDFFLTSMNADVLVNRLKINPRKESVDTESEDVQREPSKKRIRDIAEYIKDPDATFPTAVIISCDSRYTTFQDHAIQFHGEPRRADDFGQETIHSPIDVDALPSGTVIGELLDGQHRIKGLLEAQRLGTNISSFQLPVVVMLDLDLAEKAYVFSIINSKQTPVPKSLIYDLFGLSNTRSPYLTCHEIARAMNTEPGGAFQGGLKMLGKRRLPSEMLTQGSFVKSLLRMITSTPDSDALALKTGQVVKESNRPFNAFFRNKRDELILKAMQNYFSAVANVFKSEWDIYSYVDEGGKPLPQPTPVLRRTVGYEALMKALEVVWPQVQAHGDLDKPFFETLVKKFQQNSARTPLTTEYFGSSSADAGRLAALMTNEIVDVPERAFELRSME